MPLLAAGATESTTSDTKEGEEDALVRSKEFSISLCTYGVESWFNNPENADGIFSCLKGLAYLSYLPAIDVKVISFLGLSTGFIHMLLYHSMYIRK